MQAEQPEHPALLIGDLTVGQVEHRADRAIAHREFVQAARLGAEQLGEIGQRPRGACLEAPSGQRHRKGQVPAAPDDLLRGVPLGHHPVAANHLGELGDRFVGSEQAEGQGLDAVQPDQLPPAGDEHPAGRAARHKRSHLLLVRRVVQQYDCPLTVQPVPIQRRPGLRLAGDLTAWHPEQAQERFQGCRRIGRRPAWAVTTQVHVQLDIVELKSPSELMSHMYGKPGLANPGHARDHREGHRRSVVVRRQRLEQLAQFLFPTGELPDVHGQLCPRGHGRPDQLPAARRLRAVRPRRLTVAADRFWPIIERYPAVNLLPPVEPNLLGRLERTHDGTDLQPGNKAFAAGHPVLERAASDLGPAPQLPVRQPALTSHGVEPAPERTNRRFSTVHATHSHPSVPR
jgi:hypothetical protein